MIAPMVEGGIYVRHDRPLCLATAKSKLERNWKNETTTWNKLLNRLSKVYRDYDVTERQYAGMPKDQKDLLKDKHGGFVGGELKDGLRRSGHVNKRSLLSLDLDSIPDESCVTKIADRFREKYSNAFCMYSTRSHTTAKPKLRLIIPLRRDVSPDEYEAVGRRIASDIELEWFDDTTYQPERLMYWPACNYDTQPIFDYEDAVMLDPDAVLDTYTDWRDTALWPRSSRDKAVRKNTVARVEDPLTKKGIVGAFCRTFTVYDVIERFLSDVYEESGSDRYTYLNGSSKGGLVVYNGGILAYSNHSTDPAREQCCNAFDLVRIHKFGEKDAELPPDTPITRKDSYIAMAEFAHSIPEVNRQFRIDSVPDTDWDPTDFPTENDNWEVELKTQMDISDKGKVMPSMRNFYLILKYNPKYQNLRFNAFTNRYETIGLLPWGGTFEDRLMSRRTALTDMDLDCMQYEIASEYNIVSPANLRVALSKYMSEPCNRFHPVKDYLLRCEREWDGSPRLSTMLHDIVGGEKTKVVQQMTRKALIGAVKRIMEPGCKHDYVLMLVGGQGAGKSSILYRLGGPWFSDSFSSYTGKEAYEALQGAWIIELAEMAANKKTDHEHIKQFISKREDSYRAAYGHLVETHPRQCAMFGTTNDMEILRDPTGNRRFWPVEILKTGYRDLSGVPDEYFNQVWGEAVAAWRIGEKHYFESDDEEMQRLVKAQQDRFTEEDPNAPTIREFLDRPVPTRWYDMSPQERIEWLNPDFDDDSKASEPMMQRQMICAKEVYLACWGLNGGNPAAKMQQKDARQIKDIISATGEWESKNIHIPGYGAMQKGFVRIGGTE